MKYSKDEKVDAMVRELLARGAVLEAKGRGKHWGLVFPNGVKTAIVWQPSDYRAGLNWVSQVKHLIAQGAFDVRKTAPQK